MGRTHKTLTYEQERKLHRDGQITKVKGVHSWDRRVTSNRPPVHVDRVEEEEDMEDRENPFYEQILAIFKDGIANPVFATSFLEALQNDSDESIIADLMVTYLGQIITDENIEDVPGFGDMTEYDPVEFGEYAADYFYFMGQSSLDVWIDSYESI